jgi:hypothetical protein
MPPPRKKRRKELTLNDRKACFAMLLMHASNGLLKRGSFVSTARKFGVSSHCVKRVWRAVISNMQAHLEEQDDHFNFVRLEELVLPLCMFPDKVFLSNKFGKVGKKKKINRVELAEATARLPLNERGTYRNHAAALNISKSSSHRILKEEKKLRIVSSDIKPSLTEENKYKQFEFCLSFIDKRSMVVTRSEHDWQYSTMYADVHVDEKWFFLTKAQRRYILASWEQAPRRSTHHKGDVEKVMFLNAQARPRHYTAKNQM